jgi:hypothetical protein
METDGCVLGLLETDCQKRPTVTRAKAGSQGAQHQGRSCGWTTGVQASKVVAGTVRFQA